MSIQEVSGKFKVYANTTDIFLVLIVVATTVSGFVLGRYSVQDIPKSPASVIEYSEPQSTKNDAGKRYVGSKTGTKYHHPECAGALRIKEENKVWFSSKEAAELAGYTPASNCPQIQTTSQ